MNPPNSLENQLKSWIPRAPSPGLEARLFGGRAHEIAGRQPRAVWLMPAAAMGLVLLVVGLSPADPARLARPAPAPMLAMSLSNQSWAAFAPVGFSGRRYLPSPGRLVERFGWTKTADFHSSTPFFTRFQTNL